MALNFANLAALRATFEPYFHCACAGYNFDTGIRFLDPDFVIGDDISAICKLRFVDFCI